MPVDPRRVKELFGMAVELPDAQSRQALLERECVGDTELRQRLEVLLHAHDHPLPALEQPLASVAPVAVERTGPYQPAEQLVGRIIAGKYKLLQVIGEGGMGAVYMADQLDPVKRRVAVKLIRENRDSAQVLARFEAERQALALMDHPHIAKVLDAGTTDAARPYFVMELVKGVPVTEFCDEHHLSVGERLTLFRQICSAVHHAHQKGIIHRDLKPSNILVESHDGKPVPKVIDFGLAKATSGVALTEHTLFTALGQVAGTPLYMAPEQAAFNAIDVDTRADIYALGVILYELVTGSTPIERASLKKAAFDEILRMVREHEPPTPSKRLSSSQALPSIAANRQTEPVKLGRFVRGELDWIVMKALSKDRDRRYESATAFAADVERFLNHEPVIAGPPTVGYKLRKFVRRNKGPVLATTLVLLALLGGIIGTTWGLIRAEYHRRIAEEQKQKAEQAEAETLADYRASTDDAIEQLIGSKPELGPQEKAYLENTLKRWQAYADRQGDDERSRVVGSEGHYRVAQLLTTLGRADEALTEFQKARELDLILVEQFPDVIVYQARLAGTHNNMGFVLSDLSRWDEARTEYERALNIGKKLAKQLPSVRQYQEIVAKAHNNLGVLLSDLGKREDARAEYEQARDIHKQLTMQFPAEPEYQKGLADAHHNLGNLLDNLGQRQEACREYEQAQDIYKKLAGKFPAATKYQIGLGRSHIGLGSVLGVLGKLKEGRAECDRALEIYQRLAKQFPGVRAYQIELGLSCYNIGKLIYLGDEPGNSLQWFESAIKTLTPLLEKEAHDPEARKALRNSLKGRAVVYDELEKHAEAVPDWDKVIELSPVAERPELRALRATSLLQAGQVANAVAEVAELAQSSNWKAGQWYDFACVYAVASGKIADKKQQYADRAMELLQQAVKAGWKDAAQMEKDRDLGTIRVRDDFKKLVESLSKPQPKGKSPSSSDKN